MTLPGGDIQIPETTVGALLYVLIDTGARFFGVFLGVFLMLGSFERILELGLTTHPIKLFWTVLGLFGCFLVASGVLLIHEMNEKFFLEQGDDAYEKES